MRARLQHAADTRHDPRRRDQLARAGASKLWAGTVSVQPEAKAGAHHHGHLESIIYVVRDRARMRWGERLEYVAEADPGDFIYVPPSVPRQEINALTGEPLECVLVRSDQEPVVVNLDIELAEHPEEVRWIDPDHPRAGSRSSGVGCLQDLDQA